MAARLLLFLVGEDLELGHRDVDLGLDVVHDLCRERVIGASEPMFFLHACVFLVSPRSTTLGGKKGASSPDTLDIFDVQNVVFFGRIK